MYNEDNRNSSGVSIYVTSGHSMWPYIKPRDRVVVKRIPVNDLRIGDVIVYTHNEKIICHRLLKKELSREKSLLYTRGDNLCSVSLVDAAMFLGQVVALKRNDKIIPYVTRKRRIINILILIFAPLFTVTKRTLRYLLEKRFML